MLNLRYQKATLEDLELLVTVRCRVLRAANLLPDDAPLPEVEFRHGPITGRPLPRTPTRHISSGTEIHWLARAL